MFSCSLIGNSSSRNMKIALILCFFTIVNSKDALGFHLMALIPPRISNQWENVEDDNYEVFTLAAKSVLVEDDSSKLRRAHIDCIDETHVDPDLVKKFRNGSWNQDPPALKKWALCVLARMELMSRQGVYRYDTAMSKINADEKAQADKLIELCLSKKPKPPHVLAWNYLRCMSRNDKKRDFPTLGIHQTF